MATGTLVGLASRALESDYFEFNDRFYMQKLGTAIGMKFAMVCANFFMNQLEGRLLGVQANSPLIWTRLVDDNSLSGCTGKKICSPPQSSQH